jgi:hypothetical protein
VKCDKEILEALEAFDTTGSAHSAAQLAGVCGPEDSAALCRREGCRCAGNAPSRGRIRADLVHGRIVALGFGGDERTTRRAVAAAKRVAGW